LDARHAPGRRRPAERPAAAGRPADVTSPLFSQATGDDRLYWLDDASWSGTGGFGLVLFAGSTGAPATLDLAASFTEYPGYYITIAIRPATSAEPAFVEAVLDLGG